MSVWSSHSFSAPVHCCKASALSSQDNCFWLFCESQIRIKTLLAAGWDVKQAANWLMLTALFTILLKFQSAENWHVENSTVKENIMHSQCQQDFAEDRWNVSSSIPSSQSACKERFFSYEIQRQTDSCQGKVRQEWKESSGMLHSLSLWSLENAQHLAIYFLILLHRQCNRDTFIPAQLVHYLGLFTW